MVIDLSLEEVVGHLPADPSLAWTLDTPEGRLATLALIHREIASWDESHRALVALLVTLTEREAIERERERRHKSSLWRRWLPQGKGRIHR